MLEHSPPNAEQHRVQGSTEQNFTQDHRSNANGGTTVVRSEEQFSTDATAQSATKSAATDAGNPPVKSHSAAIEASPAQAEDHDLANQSVIHPVVTVDNSNKANHATHMSGQSMTRLEEMAAASKLLKEPDLDGNRILSMVQQATVVSGGGRTRRLASIYFDEGSTFTIVTRALVRALNLSKRRKALIVESFGHTEEINTECVVLDLLKSDGSVAQVTAYVVDKITSVAKVEVPDEIRKEFQSTTPWPESRHSGEVDILLGLEELALHPILVERQGNLGVFLSPLSPTTILGGRHDKIFAATTRLSQACNLVTASTNQQGSQPQPASHAVSTTASDKSVNDTQSNPEQSEESPLSAAHAHYR